MRPAGGVRSCRRCRPCRRRPTRAPGQRRAGATRRRPGAIRISLVDHGGHSGGPTTSRASLGFLLSRPSRSRAAAGRPEQFPLRYDVEVKVILSRRDQYATLVQELAHVYCGHLGSPNEKNWPSRPRTPHDVAEVEAESVVHMILSRVDPNVAMGDYIQGHLYDAGSPAGVSLNVMTKVAGLMEDMGNSWLPARKRGRNCSMRDPPCPVRASRATLARRVMVSGPGPRTHPLGKISAATSLRPPRASLSQATSTLSMSPCRRRSRD